MENIDSEIDINSNNKTQIMGCNFGQWPCE